LEKVRLVFSVTGMTLFNRNMFNQKICNIDRLEHCPGLTADPQLLVPLPPVGTTQLWKILKAVSDLGKL
jgi:hypothetical protein